MLALVVGPSGAGKDTLLDAARTRLAGDPRIRFARRTITRPPQPGWEENEGVDRATFEARRAAGGFLLHWEAHGLRYGIPSEAAAWLAAGQVVVASVSRTVLAEAASRFPTLVIEVTAPAELIRRRLEDRGREDAAGVTQRIARTADLPPGMDILRISNDGTVEEGAARLAAALLRCADHPHPP